MNEWDDEYDEYGDSDTDFDDETGTITCQECGAEVYEDAPMCPRCGAYVTRSTHPFVGRPNWFVALGVLGIIVTILALTLH